MPTPDELRALAERAKELTDRSNTVALADACHDLATAVLSLLQENERLRKRNIALGDVIEKLQPEVPDDR